MQDFPKRQADSGAAASYNLVQGKAKSGDVAIVEPLSTHNPTTTLTIVQDFPKKKVDSSRLESVEMVHTKTHDFFV